MRTVYTELFHTGFSSQEGYHGSVQESELCEDRSLITFFTGGDELFVVQKEENNFDILQRSQPYEDLPWAQREKT